MELFRCSTDINGPLNTSPGASTLLTPNGIPDGEYELGLLAAVLNNTGTLNPAVTGGVTNDQVMTAFKANFDYFRVMVTTAFANVPSKTDLRNLMPSFAGPYLHTGLTMIFAAYATEGDAVSLAALDALIGSLGGLGFVPPADGVGAHTTGFGSILGPQGDADGDGFSNKAEYDSFKTLGAAATIAAQLTPNAAPPTPVLGGIFINANLPSTNNRAVTLTLTATRTVGPAVVRMRFSDDGAHWTAWEPIAATRNHTLPGTDGYKTVRVQYMDRDGIRSAVFSDYIRLDTTPPTGGIVINNGAAVSVSPSVTLGLNWSDGAGSGVTRMRFSDDGAHWTAWEALAVTAVHTLAPPNGYHTVRVQFLDAVGNYSPIYSDYINLQVP